MSKGNRRNQPVVEESEEEETPRSPSVGGEGNMIVMFKMLMDERRREDDRREEERRREESRREEARAEREREELRLLEERQKAFEERQAAQQIAILKTQAEMGERANRAYRDGQNEDRKRNRALMSISCLKEGEDLEEFFDGAERRLQGAEVREDEWMSVIDSKLSGQVAASWRDIVVTAGDYREAKSRLLKLCGYTPQGRIQGGVVGVATPPFALTS